MRERQLTWLDDLLFDQSTITPYTWYDFDDDASALSKVLVKVHSEMNEPNDIAEESPIVKALRDEKLGRVQRVYAPDREKVEELGEILKEMRR